MEVREKQHFIKLCIEKEISYNLSIRFLKSKSRSVMLFSYPVLKDISLWFLLQTFIKYRAAKTVSPPNVGYPKVIGFDFKVLMFWMGRARVIFYVLSKGYALEKDEVWRFPREKIKPCTVFFSLYQKLNILKVY